LNCFRNELQRQANRSYYDNGLRKPGQPSARFLFAVLFAITLALRLCHSRILWADEDYHLAAGIQVLHGKFLYRDLWYDKPPLAALVYAAMGAFPGWPLRLFDAVYVLAICASMFRFARDVWGEREGLWAAALLGFFLNFDHATAIIPIAPDFFMVLPHIAAVHSAWRGKALQAGLWSSAALLFHTKGLFVFAMCLLIDWSTVVPLLAGFLIPIGATAILLAWGGALSACLQQVWQWGFAYARTPAAGISPATVLRRIADWCGFHAALLIGAAWQLWSDRKHRAWIAAWIILSFTGAIVGGQSAPRYFLQLLPPLVLAASRGMVILAVRSTWSPNRLAWAVVAGITLLVPLIRFGPRYISLAEDLIIGRAHRWSDVVLDQDAQAAAAVINEHKRGGDTLFVWGYRPDVFVYTRLSTASLFWDSQPLTGVPADRHLFDSRPILPALAATDRAALVSTRPTFIVDGLSALNPHLSIGRYSELQAWLRDYQPIARTDLSIVYRRVDIGVAGTMRTIK